MEGSARAVSTYRGWGKPRTREGRCRTGGPTRCRCRRPEGWRWHGRCTCAFCTLAWRPSQGVGGRRAIASSATDGGCGRGRRIVSAPRASATRCQQTGKPRRSGRDCRVAVRDEDGGASGQPTHCRLASSSASALRRWASASAVRPTRAACRCCSASRSCTAAAICSSSCCSRRSSLSGWAIRGSSHHSPVLCKLSSRPENGHPLALCESWPTCHLTILPMSKSLSLCRGHPRLQDQSQR
jgi:hypothetical protein